MRLEEDNSEYEEKEDSPVYFYITSVSMAIIAISILMRVIYLPATINGVSMNNTLKDGNVLAFSLLAKETVGISRGDIVAIKAKVQGKELNIVKRVIGLPGDNIKILNGVVFINNSEIIESYLPKGSVTEGHIDTDLKSNEYFCMGDNRLHSMDSREPTIGAINHKNIMGIVVNRDIKSKKHTNTEEDIDIENIEIPEGFFREMEIKE